MSSPFRPGDLVGDDFAVESLLAVTPTRTVYVAAEARHDRRSRRCWSCLFAGVPRQDAVCPRCGGPITERRFLLSVREDRARLQAQEELAGARLDHPGLASPALTFRDAGHFVAAYLWRGERLLAGEPAPVGAVRPDAENRVVRALQFLRSRNVGVQRLGPEHLLWSEGDLRLFDPDVCDLTELDAALAPAEAELQRLLARCFGDGDGTGAPRGPAAAATHVGKVRAHNEDAWSWAELPRQALLLAVADGMGGHALGDVASRVALDASEVWLAERISSGQPVSEALVAGALGHAHAAVRSVGASRLSDLGTTLVLAVVQGRRAVLGHVGDSRVYVFGRGTFRQVTSDQSLVAGMVRRGELTAEQARGHRYSNILSQAIGAGSSLPKPETLTVVLDAGESLLLCSDGVWGELSDGILAAVLAGSGTPREACRRVIQAVLAGEARDNATAVVFTHRGGADA